MGCAGDPQGTSRRPESTRETPAAEAIASCRQAFADVAAAADIAAIVPRLFAACADLHTAPACREAWRTAATVPPEMRLAVAAAGCQRAYCPDLPAPRPALCEREIASLPPSELGPAWGELERVVLTRELGDAGAPFGEGFSRLATPIVVPVPPPAPAPAASVTVTLFIRREGAALVVARLDRPAERVTLPAGADGATAATRLGPLLPGVERVVLAADQSLPYQDVVRVIDAVRAAGITEFAISVEPEAAPSPSTR
jgi:hypothetical protein